MSVPKTIDIMIIVGVDFLSSFATIIIVGKANAKPTILPFNHQVIPYKSILNITNGSMK